MAETILVIEDDESLAQLVQLLLRRTGYNVLVANRGDAGIEIVRHNIPDLILLDILMPDMDGWHVYEELRRITDTPIIFLTALGNEHNITYGLGLGADDYITKPFGYNELITRVKAALSRAKRARGEQTILNAGPFWVNLETHEVKINDRVVELTPTEFSLFVALLQDAGRVVTHDSLLRRVWGPEYSERRDYLKLYIWYLRQKIETDPRHPRYLVSERGQGYRLIINPEKA